MKHQVPENPAKNRKSTDILTIVTSLLITLYLTSNLMAVRIIQVGEFSLFDAGTIVFPLTYMLGDALTEVWGFRTARKTIILTAICNLILVGFTALGCLLPVPEYQTELAAAYQTIFGFVPRILFASAAAFLGGELINSFVMVRLKEKTQGKYLWVRTILSSVAGHAFDTTLFVFLAFWGVSPFGELVSMIVVQYLLKVLLEAVAGTPLVYGFVGWLKGRTEG